MRTGSRALFCAALAVALYACDDASSDDRATTSDALGEVDGGVDDGGLGDAGDDGATEPQPAVPPDYAEYQHHPAPPTILRDVAMVDDDAEFVHPYVPGHRTTMDGRVAIRVQGGPPGTERIATNLSFFLFVPERLETPIMPGPAGARILAETEPFDVLFPPALDERVDRLGHHAICDPTMEFAVEGERTNPYPCGPDERHDCYDITVVSSTSPGVGARLWGTPVTIEVENPKTPEARIIDATLGEPVAGVEIPLTGEWTEPAVTIDGRLLTGRWGRAPRSWTNPNTGESMIRPWDLAYSVLPEDAEPCDVTGWTEFHPMSHAPYDPRMVDRYGLAAYPFRDSEGEPIPDGEDLGGTYPWVDREGANVFMAAVPGRLVEQSEEKFPRRCVHEGCEGFLENTDWDRGFMVAGLWTHGKFVHLDAMINNMDWAVGVTPASHFWVDLYRDAQGEPVPVRFGGGRFIDSVRYAGGPYPPGYTHNANILDSLQHLPNHVPEARPVTPRDVVWVMSTGIATDEVAFDDFLDPNALIVSNMQGSITQVYTDDGRSTSFPRYWNGQLRRLTLNIPVAGAFVLEPDVDDEVHVQNAATSLDWNVPPYGHVEAGRGRIEPVALGGITGKGFWMSDSEITYPIPAQDRPVDESDWYAGVFLDSRADEARVVARFPDGTALHLERTDTVRYVVDGTIVREVSIPPSDGWFHLGLELRDRNRHVTLVHNGFAIDRFESERPLFVPTEGDLVLGSIGPDEDGFEGFRGWIDEFKVFAYVPDPEVVCNHAHGTLVEVIDDDELLRLGTCYPGWAHQRVADAAGSDGRWFACWHDHSADYAAHLANIPDGAVSLREAITFPEGPIRVGAPRPDSTQNAFCRSCHTDQGLGGLSTDALVYDPDTLAEDDLRRQPLQPPRRVFGNVPAGWIPADEAPGSPDEHLQAPPGGLVIDHWVLPSVE